MQAQSIFISNEKPEHLLKCNVKEGNHSNSPNNQSIFSLNVFCSSHQCMIADGTKMVCVCPVHKLHNWNGFLFQVIYWNFYWFRNIIISIQKYIKLHWLKQSFSYIAFKQIIGFFVLISEDGYWAKSESLSCLICFFFRCKTHKWC